MSKLVNGEEHDSSPGSMITESTTWTLTIWYHKMLKIRTLAFSVLSRSSPNDTLHKPALVFLSKSTFPSLSRALCLCLHLLNHL